MPRCDYCPEEAKWLRWRPRTALDEMMHSIHGVPGATSEALRACDVHKDRIEAPKAKEAD